MFLANKLPAEYQRSLFGISSTTISYLKYFKLAVANSRINKRCSISIGDTYSHVAPGLQQAAADHFDDIVLPAEIKPVG